MGPVTEEKTKNWTEAIRLKIYAKPGLLILGLEKSNDFE